MVGYREAFRRLVRAVRAYDAAIKLTAQHVVAGQWVDQSPELDDLYEEMIEAAAVQPEE